MKRLSLLLLLLHAGTTYAEPNYSPLAFANDLTCATKLAAAVPGVVDGHRVRRAVDRCMAASLPMKQLVAYSSAPRMVDLEYRRETLTMATMERMQLCKTTGIPLDQFASRCPQLFTLDTK
jgi:hypothetical protein